MYNLLEVLQLGRKIDSSRMMGDLDNELFESYLNAFWLRPETAVFQFKECRIVQKMFSRVFEPPFLDIGCGDGVNTSFLLGWNFAGDFDVYQQLDLHADDIYDAVPHRPITTHVVKPGRPIDYGMDIKLSMVHRAKLLGTFCRLLQADASSLPLDNSSVGCIYSNVIRDFDGEMLDAVLEECARVLRPGGHLIFSSPTEDYKESLFYYPRGAMYRRQSNDELADLYMKLDRGRSLFCRQQVPLADWEARLSRFGLGIVENVEFAPPALLQLWDTGLRPFSPYLVRWASLLRQGDSFIEAKRMAVSAMKAILRSFVADGPGDEPNGFRVVLVRMASP